MDDVDDICPDCKRPIASHAMFNPPRCPVIRLSWKLPVWVDEMVPRGYVEVRRADGRLECRQRLDW